MDPNNPVVILAKYPDSVGKVPVFKKKLIYLDFL